MNLTTRDWRWLTVSIWLSIMGITLIVGGATLADDIGEWSALLQSVLALALVPIAIYGFTRLAEEVRESLARPELVLKWMPLGEDCTDELTIAQPAHGHRMAYIPFAVVNAGTVVTQWFMAAVQAPEFLIGHGDIPGYEVVDILGDKARNWRWVPYGAWQTLPEAERSGGPWITFLSNGNFGSYPEWPLRLGALVVTLDASAQYLTTYEAEFRIVGDRSEPRRGFLRLNVVRDGDGN